jgi:hypothetical protein
MNPMLTVYEMAAAAERPTLMRQVHQAQQLAEARGTTLTGHGSPLRMRAARALGTLAAALTWDARQCATTGANRPARAPIAAVPRRA